MHAASFHVSFLSCGAPRWKGPYPRSGGTTLLRVTTLLRATPLLRWNYPFHNVLNPIAAALLSGNAVVIKVSEHAAWSSRFYGKRTDACLACPPPLNLSLSLSLSLVLTLTLSSTLSLTLSLSLTLTLTLTLTPNSDPEPQSNPETQPDPNPNPCL